MRRRFTVGGALEMFSLPLPLPLPLPKYSLCNFYGATMMIKGSLLLSIPIVKRFQARKTSPVLRQILTILRNKWGLNIKFKFYNLQTHILA